MVLNFFRYLYFGLKNTIVQFLKENPSFVNDHHVTELKVNVDRLPLKNHQLIISGQFCGVLKTIGLLCYVCFMEKVNHILFKNFYQILFLNT